MGDVTVLELHRTSPHLLHKLAREVHQSADAAARATARSTSTHFTLHIHLECHLRCLGNCVLLGSTRVLSNVSFFL